MPTEKKTTKITPKVNLINLMVEMANTCQTMACSMGVQMSSIVLQRIAKRACELNDPQLLEDLRQLDLVTEE